MHAMPMENDCGAFARKWGEDCYLKIFYTDTSSSSSSTLNLSLKRLPLVKYMVNPIENSFSSIAHNETCPCCDSWKDVSILV